MYLFPRAGFLSKTFVERVYQMKNWNPWKPKGYGRMNPMSGSTKQSVVKRREPLPLHTDTALHSDTNLHASPSVHEVPVTQAIRIPSRPITLVHYQQILTAIQVLADGLT